MMNVLVVKTNIDSNDLIQAISPTLDAHPSIATWNIDINDVDNVLRICTPNGLTESKVVDLIQAAGYRCALLPD